MRKVDDLDAALFELHDAPPPDYQLIRNVAGPLDNRKFIINMAIGLGCYVLIPFAIVAICYLLGH